MKDYYTVSGLGDTGVIKGTWSIHVTGVYNVETAMRRGKEKLMLDHPRVFFMLFRLYAIGESQYTSNPILIETI